MCVCVCVRVRVRVCVCLLFFLLFFYVHISFQFIGYREVTFIRFHNSTFIMHPFLTLIAFDAFFTCTIAHFVSAYRLQGGYFHSCSVTCVHFHNSAFTMHPVLTLTPTLTNFVQIPSPNSNPNLHMHEKRIPDFPGLN